MAAPLGEALAESSPDAAIAAFEKAAQIIPNVRGEDSPNARIAALALKKNDKARAARALETLTSYDHTDVKAARQLVTLIDVKDVPRMQATLRRITSIDPFDGDAQTALGQAALATQQPPLAVRAAAAGLACRPRWAAACLLQRNVIALTKPTRGEIGRASCRERV